MIQLIQAECLKLSKSLGYKVLLLVALGMGVLIGCAMVFLAGETGSTLGGFDLYVQNLGGSSQFSSILLSVLAAIVVCHEFNNRTFGMSLSGGLSRSKLWTAKVITFLLASIPLLFLMPVVSCLIAGFKNGFSSTASNGLTEIAPGLSLAPSLGIPTLTLLYLLGSLTLAAFCLFLSSLIKNVGGTIGAGIGFVILAQLGTAFIKNETVKNLVFIHQLDNLIRLDGGKSVPLFIGVCGISLVVFLMLSLLIVEKSDLK
ncbi:hypothetical protein FACS1894111_01830 [Clostridia bacterium]|nr:hypothetical protein FACS1894111_01830 [Clostridia bacterium]